MGTHVMAPNLDENSREQEATRAKKVRIFVSQMCVLSLATGIEDFKKRNTARFWVHCPQLGAESRSTKYFVGNLRFLLPTTI
jgi:hypothetical protein